MSNNREPLISVVLPSYNHAKYLRECIDSVLNQTYKNIEFIIVDDCSTDNSKEIILSYKDKRIHTYFFKKNKGAVYTQNFSIKKSKGEYISILNSDDAYYPQKIEKQYNFLLKNKNVSAVFSYAQAINENSEEIKIENNPLEPKKSITASRTDFLKIFLESGNIFIHPSLLIKREVYNKIGFYDCRLNQIPDFEYWVRMCVNGFEIKVIPEKLIKYRFRDNEQNTSNGNRSDVSNRLIFEYQYLLKNYFDLEAEDIKKIFEIPSEYKNINENNKKFILAQLIFNYHHNDLYQSVYKLVALNKLFSLINNKKTKKYLKSEYNFSYPQLIKQTGEKQIFNPMSNSETMNIQNVEKINNQLNEIKNSRTWQFISLIRVFFDKVPIIRKIARLLFSFFKKTTNLIKITKNIIKHIVVLTRPIKINFKKKTSVKIVPVNIKKSELIKFDSRYFLLLEDGDETSSECIDVCLFITETFGVDCVKIRNRRENVARYFIKQTAVKNKKNKIYEINDDYHLIKKIDKKKNISFIEKIDHKIIKNIFPFNVIKPFINQKTENKLGVLTVLPFILHSPNHLTTTIIKTLKQNGYNNFVLNTEDIFPNYLRIGDGFNEISKYSDNVFYLNEILPKYYWYLFFKYLIKKRNISYIFNIGSEYFYEIIKKVKRTFPNIKIIDIQFNDYGHVKSHIKNIKYIDTVITENEKIKKSLIDRGSDGHKIKVIRTGTNLNIFNSNLKDKKNIQINKAYFNINNDKKFIISYLGRLSEEKNPEAILNIAERFINNKNILFLLAGDGPLKETIERKIEQKNLSNVKLLGQQDPKKVLSMSNITLLTSIIDGSPSSIRESMAVGIPVISSNVGGISEMISNNTNGFLIDPANIEKHYEIINRLANDQDFYKKISKSAIDYAIDNFNEDKLLSKYIETIKCTT